jgi:hypothetical protein
MNLQVGGVVAETVSPLRAAGIVQSG